MWANQPQDQLEGTGGIEDDSGLQAIAAMLGIRALALAALASAYVVSTTFRRDFSGRPIKG